MEEIFQKFHEFLLLEKEKIQKCLNHPNEKAKMLFWTENEDYSTARKMLLASVGSISHESTKVSLLCTQNPPADQIFSILQTFYEPIEQLLSALHVAVYCGTGQELTLELYTKVNHILHGIQQLIEYLMKNCTQETKINEKQGKEIAMYTGRIWDACEMLQKLPQSNRIAMRRNVLECLSFLKETIEEVDEMVIHSQQIEGKMMNLSVSEEEKSIEEEMDEWMMNGRYEPTELEFMKPLVNFWKIWFRILKETLNQCKKIEISKDKKEEKQMFEALTNCSFWCFKWKEQMIQMGSLVFPPVECHSLHEIFNLEMENFMKQFQTFEDILFQFPSSTMSKDQWQKLWKKAFEIFQQLQNQFQEYVVKEENANKRFEEEITNQIK